MTKVFRIAVVTAVMALAANWSSAQSSARGGTTFCDEEALAGFCYPSYESCMGGCEGDPRCLCFCGCELSGCAWTFGCGTGCTPGHCE
jgi:hypothetical protein